MKQKIVEKFSKIDSRGLTLLTPFVVNKSRKTLYFHIAKTGGSTITKILRNNKLDDMILSNKKLSYTDKYLYFEEIAEYWDEYYKFTFVRNKYDQLVSHWHYDRNPCGNFKKFIKNIVVSDQGIYGYWIDQYYLTMYDDKSIFDFIGRYENFNDDLQYILNKIGIKKYNKKLGVNVGKYNRKLRFSKYYDLKTKQLVYNKFKKEIDHFGFRMERV